MHDNGLYGQEIVATPDSELMEIDSPTPVVSLSIADLLYVRDLH